MREKSAAVRQRILAAALTTFCDVGYEGASTRAIAERAQMAHPLMRYYFRTKEDLWVALIGELMTEFNSGLSAALDELNDRDPAAVLRIIIDRMVRLGARVPGFHRLTIMESTQNSAKLKWLVDHHFRSLYGLLRKYVEAGQAQGKVRKIDPLRLTCGIAAMVGGLFSSAHQIELLSGEDMLSPEDVEKTIAFVYSVVFED